MTWLQLKFPPPLVALVFLIHLGLVAYLYPDTIFSFPYQSYIAVIIGLIGLALGITASIEFRKVKTAVNPRKPELAQSLVTNGIFKYSRNPMYLGLVIIICAAVIFAGNFITLMHPILLVMYLHFFQIRPEERILLDKFGEDYLVYMTHTRRWI
ncbi:methyltransferase family protein [Curvivirga sp.]|uniref:methyltransferase family protein n=1 Tax=Curvivirga sp. TaxID=2856848 RepID=UPI003B5BE13F